MQELVLMDSGTRYRRDLPAFMIEFYMAPEGLFPSPDIHSRFW